MKNKTFAIVGGTLWGNRGAEAMIVTTIGRIRDQFPEASFLILSYYPKVDDQLIRESDVSYVKVESGTPSSLLFKHFPLALICWFFRAIGIKIPNVFLPQSLSRLRDCSLLFDVSGISFHDGRLAIVVYNIFCIWPALLLGVPVVQLSQARGPFNNIFNRITARWFLRACIHSFARGRITAKHMDALELPNDRSSIAADIAFSFKTGDSITHENDQKIKSLYEVIQKYKISGSKIIALSPSSVVFKKTAQVGIDYVDIVSRAVIHLQNRGYNLLILPNATRAGGTGGRNNDFFVISQLHDAIMRNGGITAPSHVFWVDFDLNTDSIRLLIKQCDLLITSRFHAMVAGLSLCIPTFVIGWSHKYEEVLEMFGCESNAIDFSSMEDRLIFEIDKQLENLNDSRNRITNSLPKVIASSQKQFQIIDRFLK
jgi:polysaccharide pyruvyl transferase WcaK-like protein